MARTEHRLDALAGGGGMYRQGTVRGRGWAAMVASNTGCRKMILGDLSISPLYEKWQSIPGSRLLRRVPDWGDAICVSLNITASLQELEILGVQLRHILAYTVTVGQPINIDLDLTSKLVNILDENKSDFDIKDWQIAKFQEVLSRYEVIDTES
jgi:hypothetical protein